jgi:hypothetical protein
VAERRATLSRYPKAGGIHDGDGAALVRPDGHVALRVRTLAADCHATLAGALERILRGAA